MTINEFLIKAHKELDAATVENELNNEAMCMYHLGGLHGLLIKFTESKKLNKCESDESSSGQ